jgi:hypothetical protein
MPFDALLLKEIRPFYGTPDTEEWNRWNSHLQKSGGNWKMGRRFSKVEISTYRISDELA